MKHKIEIVPNLAICIDGERVIGSKPHGLFLTTEMIVSDEDLKRLSDRCLEVITNTPQTDCKEPIECEGCGEHICIGCEHQARKEEWRKAQADCPWK